MATRPPLVIITGCGSGIGQALARAFHARGLPVCATARRLDTLAPLAAEGLMTRPLDVTDEASVQALLTGLAQEGHQIGTLVNNAGYGAMGPMLDVPTAEWQRQFDVNLFAPMALTRAVLPGTRSTWASRSPQGSVNQLSRSSSPSVAEVKIQAVPAGGSYGAVGAFSCGSASCPLPS